MTLSSAIREGIKKRPGQCFGVYYQGAEKSCALGAAYDGINRPIDAHHDVRHEVFPGMNERVACPVSGHVVRGSVYEIIIHLSDSHLWTREQIADWLEGIRL